MKNMFETVFSVCSNRRTDGKEGRCNYPRLRNLDCASCPVEGGLYEPDLFEEESLEILCIHPEMHYCPSCSFGGIDTSDMDSEGSSPWYCTLTKEKYEQYIIRRLSK